MTDDEAAALRAAAEAITKRQWRNLSGSPLVFFGDGGIRVHHGTQPAERAHYIAAASPATVLSLLAEREALRAALGEIVSTAEKKWKPMRAFRSNEEACRDELIHEAWDAAADIARAALTASAAP